MELDEIASWAEASSVQSEKDMEASSDRLEKLGLNNYHIARIVKNTSSSGRLEDEVMAEMLTACSDPAQTEPAIQSFICALRMLAGCEWAKSHILLHRKNGYSDAAIAEVVVNWLDEKHGLTVPE
jgi:hypothetical protein